MILILYLPSPAKERRPTCKPHIRPGAGGEAPLQEANWDVALDGVTFSRVECL